jgi:hypothetical protein
VRHHVLSSGLRRRRSPLNEYDVIEGVADAIDGDAFEG